MLQFRKAIAQDAESIAELYYELVPNAPINVTPQRIAEIATDDSTYLVVCEENRVPLATALISLCKDVMFNCQPFAIVENVVVSKAHQRKGVGKSLMRHIEQFCLNRDCSKIMLLSSADNSKAHDFYKNLGYSSNAKLGFIKYRRKFS